MKKPKYPVTLRKGGSEVRIYQVSSRGKQFYSVNYYWSGRRKQHTFADPDVADEHAKVVLQKLVTGIIATELEPADARAFTAAKQALLKHGVPVDVAAREYAAILDLLHGDATPLDAIRWWRSRHEVANVKVPTVVLEMLKQKAADGVSVRYMHTLKSHLPRFSTAFQCDMIGAVTTLRIEEWLDSQKISSRTWNNMRGSVVALFEFAKRKRYIHRDNHEAEDVQRKKNPVSRANIYTPAQVLKVLEAADDVILPSIAISAFAGIRSATVARLQWENILWDQGVIEVPASIAKNGKRYLVPLAANLAAWLTPYRQAEGPIADHIKFDWRIRETFKAAKVKRLPNGFRDSYISYRVAFTQNLPQVALEAGNSVEMVRSKYLEAVSQASAEAWFNVMPSSVSSPA